MRLPQPNDGFAWVQAAAGPALVCRALEGRSRHLFTTRAWTLGSAADGNSPSGWSEVARGLGVDPSRLMRVHQVHGSSVLVRRVGDSLLAGRPDADIIVSDDPSAALAVQTADCVPLLIADARTGGVAAAHAGWRGLAAGVPAHAVEAMAREFGSRPSDLVAAVGPSIGACCYEVGADVRDAFMAAGFEAQQLSSWFFDCARPNGTNPSMPGLRPPRADHWYFDGWAAARAQLEWAGVPDAGIHVAGLCTASHPDVLCSFRRDGTGAGRLAAAIIPAARREQR
jgi:hypothetical protein